MMIKVPKIIGFNKNSYEDAPKITTIGLPPAGGCVTPNKIIKKIPNPTAIVICKKSSKGKNCSTKIATKDVVKWPKNTFFGWAKGLSG